MFMRKCAQKTDAVFLEVVTDSVARSWVDAHLFSRSSSFILPVTGKVCFESLSERIIFNTGELVKRFGKKQKNRPGPSFMPIRPR